MACVFLVRYAIAQESATARRWSTRVVFAGARAASPSSARPRSWRFRPWRDSEPSASPWPPMHLREHRREGPPRRRQPSRPMCKHPRDSLGCALALGRARRFRVRIRTRAVWSAALAIITTAIAHGIVRACRADVGAAHIPAATAAKTALGRKAHVHPALVSHCLDLLFFVDADRQAVQKLREVFAVTRQHGAGPDQRVNDHANPPFPLCRVHPS